MKAIPRPEHVEGILTLPFVVMYWPLILGTVVFFIALARGHTWLAIPAAAIAGAFQAVRLGVFS